MANGGLVPDALLFQSLFKVVRLVLLAAVGPHALDQLSCLSVKETNEIQNGARDLILRLEIVCDAEIAEVVSHGAAVEGTSEALHLSWTPDVGENQLTNAGRPI